MKISLVGETYAEDSLPFNASRSINLYPVMDQTGKEVSALYGTPGLTLFGTLGTGPWSEVFPSRSTGRSFGVSGAQLYEINADGTGTARGSLLQSNNIVYMVENPTQLAICDGKNLYIFTYATNYFEQIVGSRQFTTNGSFASDTAWTKGAGWTITGGVAVATGGISTALTQNAAYTLVSGRSYTVVYTVSSLSAGTVTVSVGGTAGTARSANGTYTETIKAGATQVIAFTGAGFTGDVGTVSIIDPANGFPGNIGNIDYIDGFFVAPVNNTKQYYKSALNDGTSWSAVDFASKTSTSDPLSRVKQAVGQLWLLGTEAGEVWTDTGASSFPFQRIAGAKLTIGCQAPATAIEIDNSLFWLGQSKEGANIVYRAFGFTPMRISTTPIEYLLSQATDPANIRALSYQREGHLFYMLTGGGLPTSLVYDITTKMWHERAYQNAQGFFETHLMSCAMSWNGKIIVGDKNNGNLYVLDESAYSDNGDPQIAERIFTNLSQEDKRIRFNRLSIFCENGVGLQSGQGSAPLMELSVSRDGGRNWIGPATASMGAVGAYQTKAVFRQLGVAEQITFKLRISDPVKRRLIGSYLS